MIMRKNFLLVVAMMMSTVIFAQHHKGDGRRHDPIKKTGYKSITFGLNEKGPDLLLCLLPQYGYAVFCKGIDRLAIPESDHFPGILFVDFLTRFGEGGRLWYFPIHTC